jgi:hypothetical protein
VASTHQVSQTQTPPAGSDFKKGRGMTSNFRWTPTAVGNEVCQGDSLEVIGDPV